jgi:hypothetical protein
VGCRAACDTSRRLTAEQAPRLLGGVDEVSFSLSHNYGGVGFYKILLFLEDGKYRSIALSGYDGDDDGE